MYYYTTVCSTINNNKRLIPETRLRGGVECSQAQVFGKGGSGSQVGVGPQTGVCCTRSL